ncbi:MAG: FKBP-type peptidyl-prolyl cis-trans isomerase [Chlorobi bacterium]|nr:FKBP-type peptidyl-prolyl cis-trans isomerase [Chlorobiota bacterium]
MKGVITIFCCSLILFGGVLANAQSPIETLTDSASYAIGINFAITELIPSFEELHSNGIEIDREIVGRTIANHLLNQPTDYLPGDSSSYFLGVNMVNGVLLPALENLHTFGVEVNREVVGLGINDILFDRRTEIPDSVAQIALAQLQHRIMEGAEEFIQKIGEENRKAEEKFFEVNGTRPEVVTTESGLQYQVISEGTGRSPGLFDSVTVRCRGQLPNGFVFDQTEGESTVDYALNRVIQGWTEALQLMKPGSKWIVFIPSRLAFGENGGFDGKVGPNQMLIYEIELVAVK